MTLDLIDGKLLYMLDCNARQSLSVIAKKLRVSRSVILYRINRLKSKGIIKGSFAEVNNFALGFLSFRICIKLGNFSSTQEESLIRFVRQQKNIMWFSRVLGSWDLDIVFMAKNLSAFIAFKEELFLRYNNMFDDADISILSRMYHYPKNYLANTKRDIIEKRVIEETMHTQIDDIDVHILSLLASDAQMTIIDLAEKTGIAVNTVMKRMRSLEKSGIILGYRLLLDTNALGYQINKVHIVLKNYSQETYKQFLYYCESKSSVIYIDQYLGGADFEIELHLKNDSEYILFIEDLEKHFSKIIKSKIFIKFYKVYAFRYLPYMD